MAIEKSHGWTASLIERVKALWTRPKEAWPEIDRDTTPSGELFTRVAAPLAALAPVAGLLTGRIGWNPFSGHFIGQLFTAIIGYGLSLASLLAMSIIASRLAPRFGGEGSPRDAFKLIVYSSIPMWLASAVAMVPGFGFVGLASFYSLYLFFTGIGPMMKVPEVDKRRFGFATIVCAIGLNLVASAISSGPALMMGGRPDVQQRQAFRTHGDEVGFDGRGFLRELRDAARKGDGKTVSGSDLQALLPTRLGSFERTGLESSTGGPGGGNAEATYKDGNQAFTLKVVDLAGFGALAQMRNAIRIERSRPDENGFEHVSNKDGTFVAEKWDNDGDEGSYTTIIDKRFLIEAKGEADSFEDLKRAAASVDQARLKALEAK
ncbi:MAG: YIP1 family protein [Sphingobium sp.]|nr:YIP1 family protein [Sphingobium sp.]